MTDVTRGTGTAALKASAAAGPITLLVVTIGQLVTGETVAWRIGSAETSNAAGMAVWLSIVATIVAFVPNLIGTTIMGWVSARNVGLRHPAIWGLAGAAIIGLPAMAINAVSDPAAFAAVGALCALACRLGVRWDEGQRMSL